MRDKKITRERDCIFRTAEENDDKYIEGYFAKFDDVYEVYDGVTESIAPDAFDKSLDGDIRVLFNHNTDIVLGRTKANTATVRRDSNGIYVRCKVNPEDSAACDVYARIKRGDITQASFGGYIIVEERAENRDMDTIHYTLREVNVFEFSVCTFPAYKGTDVGARDRATAEIERWRKLRKERLEKWH